jgi:hypothetical protein
VCRTCVYANFFKIRHFFIDKNFFIKPAPTAELARGRWWHAMAHKIFARRVSGGAQVSTPWAVELVAGDVEGVVLDGGGGTQLAAGVIKMLAS